MDWSNLGTRVIVAVIFIPLILYLSWIGGIGFLLLIEVLIFLGLGEFYLLTRNKRTRPQRLLGMIAGAAVAPTIYFGQAHNLWSFFVGFSVVLLVIELFRKPEEGGSPMLNVSATLLGIAYVAGLLGFLVAIREIPLREAADYAHAGTWIIMIFIVVWICDTAAYFVGKKFGKRKLYERVSPKKTVAGAVGGIVFAVLAAIGCHYVFVQGLQLRDSIVIGLLAGTIGQISDLVESLFKRDAGVKDSSGLIPGHGGVLDRFDSEMLLAPLVYFYLTIVVR